MKKHIILFVLILPFMVGAQTNAFELQQCIDLALQNNPALQNAQLDLVINENDRAERRTRLLPHIDGEADFIHNFNIQRIILENGAIPSFTDPSRPDGEVIAFQLQLRNSLSPSIHLNQILYDKSLFETLKSDTIQNTLLKQHLAQSKTAIAVAVTKAFYSVLIGQQQLDYLDDNLQRMETIKSNTQAKVNSGLSRPIDVQRIDVSINNIQAEREKAQQNIDLGKALLTHLMHLDANRDIQLSGSLDDSLIKEALPEFMTVYDNRMEYAMVQTQQRLNESNLAIGKGAYYPRITGFAVTGYNPSATDFYDLFQKSRFYNYTMIGVHLSVPIYNGEEKRYKLNKFAIREQKLENSLTEIKELIDYQVNQAKIKYSHSLESINLQKKNLALAEANSEAIKTENEKGISQTIDVLNAETDLRLAQNNYYNALYQAIMAKVDYEQATGQIKY